MMDFSHFSSEFRGKTVLISGGSGQIGREVIKAYLLAGANLINLDLEQGRAVEEYLLSTNEINEEKLGKSYYFLVCDITNKESVRSSIKKAFERFGNVDILINCVGISVFTPFEERTEGEFESVINVNLKGAFLLTQNTIKEWKARQTKGVILNFGSIYGVSVADQRIYGDSGRNSPEVYAITKAGIIQFSKYLAKYFAKDGIRVNCLSPGGIFAGQKEFFVRNYEYKTPLGRMGTPEDLIGGVFYLTSSMSEYVTGVNLLIDGGFTIGD